MKNACEPTLLTTQMPNIMFFFDNAVIKVCQNNQLSQLLCLPPRAALQFVVAENCVRADIAHPSNAEHYVFSFTMQ